MDYIDRDLDRKPIPEFPNYWITYDGRVFNINTDREMVLSPTMQGELTVGMVRDGHQYRRSVKVLVAQAFVDGYTEIFNTPMLLDGNRDNLHADNIVWRPRWFAWKYMNQFSEPYPDWYYSGPIMSDNMRYHVILEAAMIHGLLCFDIWQSIHEGNPVFPTRQIFYKI